MEDVECQYVKRTLYSSIFIYLLSSLFSICFIIIYIFFVLPFAVDLKLYLSSSLFPSDITSRAGS